MFNRDVCKIWMEVECSVVFCNLIMMFKIDSIQVGVYGYVGFCVWFLFIVGQIVQYVFYEVFYVIWVVVECILFIFINVFVLVVIVWVM